MPLLAWLIGGAIFTACVTLLDGGGPTAAPEVEEPPVKSPRRPGHRGRTNRRGTSHRTSGRRPGRRTPTVRLGNSSALTRRSFLLALQRLGSRTATLIRQALLWLSQHSRYLVKVTKQHWHGYLSTGPWWMRLADSLLVAYAH